MNILQFESFDIFMKYYAKLFDRNKFKKKISAKFINKCFKLDTYKVYERIIFQKLILKILI